jgi:NAD(P)-dependent dehydrogenase (short-subunit alcohol dehydrogenase family)
MMRLKGRVAIVTGAGRNIGRAIALRFASEGATVAIVGPSEENIEAVSAEVTAGGANAMSVLTDVSDETAVIRMVSRVIAAFGHIDILVNNAGVIGPTAPVVNVTREEWDNTLAVNLTGAFLCSKHALPHMIERRGGRIINVTSVAGLAAYALRSPYCVSKWGMIGLTRTLADEAGKYGITVNAIAPGPVSGPRIDEVIRRRAAEMDVPVATVERQYVEPAALKRMVEEEDIAAVAAFLASDEGRNITGETITVSAGYRL